MKDTELLQEFLKSKIIVVLRGISKEKIVSVAKALAEGGIKFAEVPFDQSNADSRKETAAEIALLRKELAGRMHIGAGTVCTKEQFEQAIAAGAELIVAPNTDEEIIKATKKAGLLSVAGAFTPTEMLRAHNAGADLIKLFPAGGFSLRMLKEIAVPLNHLNFLFFGGVTADTLPEILAAGAAGVGVSSAVLDKNAIAEENFVLLSEKAKQFTAQI